MKELHELEEDLDNLTYLKSKIKNEGFHYCFKHYSSFEEIQDPEFHKLRKKYLKVADQLENLINLKYDQLIDIIENYDRE